MISISRLTSLPFRPMISAGMGCAGLSYMMSALYQRHQGTDFVTRAKSEARLARAAVWTGGAATIWMTKSTLLTVGIVGPGLFAAHRFLPRVVDPKDRPLHEVKSFLEKQTNEPHAIGNLVGYSAWERAQEMRTFSDSLGTRGGAKEIKALRKAASEMADYAEQAQRELAAICDEMESRFKALREIVAPLAQASRKAKKREEECFSAEMINAKLFHKAGIQVNFDWISEENRFSKEERVQNYTTYFSSTLERWLPSLNEVQPLEEQLCWEGANGFRALFDSAPQWRRKLETRFSQYNLSALASGAMKSLQ